MSDGIKKFYKQAQLEFIENQYQLQLDGRPAKSRAGSVLSISQKSLADAICGEWNDQEEFIDFHTMPITRYQMTSMDADETFRAQWQGEIERFFGSDLLCYRASEPASLKKMQDTRWNLFIDYLKNYSEIELAVTYDLTVIEQPADNIKKLRDYLEKASIGKILAARRITELTGSAALALSVLVGFKDEQAIIDATHCDEDHQEERWGYDKEAAERREAISIEIKDAMRFMAYLD